MRYVKDAETAAWEIARDSNGELLIERSFEVDLINPSDPEDILPIKGSIDLILEWPDGSLTIRDIKTGLPEWDPRQIKTYGWVAKSHLGLEVPKGDYFSTKLNREGNPYGSGGLISLDYTDEVVKKTYFKLSDAIKANIFLANPSVKQCQFCPVRALCPEGQ